MSTPTPDVCSRFPLGTDTMKRLVYLKLSNMATVDQTVVLSSISDIGVS